MTGNPGFNAPWDQDQRRAFLATVRLFRDLSPPTIAEIAEHTRVKRVPDGGFVFLAGTRADALNILAAGRVKVIRETDDGREVILRIIRPGDIFGGARLWGGENYPASAVALADSVVLRLSAQDSTALISDDAAFAMALIRELAGRLREAEARIQELQTERVERRIARALIRLVSKVGVKTEDGIEIDLALTRQDLADLSGTTLSTASRTLSAWDQRGLIRAGRERVVVVKPHELVALAEDLAPPPTPPE